MALSKLYYCEANCVADDATNAIGIVKSWLHALKTFPMQQKTGTRGTSGAIPAAAAWTMYYSCDGTAGGVGVAGDGVDRLGGATYNAAKWVRGNGAAAHSWFVLRSPLGISTRDPLSYYYLIVSFNGSADTQHQIVLCKNTPTGGTLTARPTSSDEVAFTAGVPMSDVTVTAHKLNFVGDGIGGFYVAIGKSGAGQPHTLFGVGELVSPGIAEGDVFPVFGVFDTMTTGRGVLSTQPTGAYGYGGFGQIGFCTRGPTGLVSNSSTQYGTGILGGYGSLLLGRSTLNTASGYQDATAAILHFVGVGVTPATAGNKGTIPDWWLTNSARSVGSCEPDAGATEHVLYGYFWVPNGGVAPAY